MIHLKVEKIGDAVAVVLDEATQAALGVKPGDTLRIEQSEDGSVVVGEDAVSRGKLFIERYLKTFEALGR